MSLWKYFPISPRLFWTPNLLEVDPFIPWLADFSITRNSCCSQQKLSCDGPLLLLIAPWCSPWGGCSTSFTVDLESPYNILSTTSPGFEPPTVCSKLNPRTPPAKKSWWRWLTDWGPRVSIFQILRWWARESTTREPLKKAPRGTSPPPRFGRAPRGFLSSDLWTRGGGTSTNFGSTISRCASRKD